jgi:hypothetical protein
MWIKLSCSICRQILAFVSSSGYTADLYNSSSFLSFVKDVTYETTCIGLSFLNLERLSKCLSKGRK